MLAEIRIESLGAISTATAEFDRGLTVLTGETGTGKTMVVTGLHLLGGARADATRVRSGADRAVVEGRFTTTELGDGVAAQVDEILDSSGAERDDDGSVIAARSVSRDGPSRAYLGGRSVPAKSLSSFTTELLTLHGQNDQLRLMRPDEQRAALDRFADVDTLLKRYRRLRDDWLAARRDLVDRKRRARELAQEADRLKFGLGEIDAVDPQPGEDDSLVADIRRLSELDALREAAQTARAALSGALDDDPSPDTPSAADGVGQARSALESTDDSVLRALAEQLGEALAVIGDVSTELGDYLAELPSDASTLEAKLARQSELRALTRKYAADIDGVLAWARESRERLAQLDVSEETLAGLERQRRRARIPSRCRGNRSHQGPNQSRQGSCQGGDRRTIGPGDVRRRIHRCRRATGRPGRRLRTDHVAVGCGRARGPRRGRRGGVRLLGTPRNRCASADQERLRR